MKRSGSVAIAAATYVNPSMRPLFACLARLFITGTLA